MDYNLHKKGVRERACDSLPLGCCTADYPISISIPYKETLTGHRVYKWPIVKKTGKFAKLTEDEPFEHPTKQSWRSRSRAGWTLGASLPGWHSMTTLTYQTPPETFDQVRKHFVLWTDRIRAKYGKNPHGWFLEFQDRAAPHFHVFWPLGLGVAALMSTEETRIYRRHRKKTIIPCGPTASYLAESWIDIVGTDTKEFRDFQRGGITEFFRTPDAAGRYVAKEGAKGAQKEAPYPVSRWWYLSPELHPVFIRTGEIPLTEWEIKHGGICLSRVWPSDSWQK